MPVPPSLPSPFDGGTFPVAAALDEGVPPSSLRSLANPWRGVRSHVNLAGVEEQMRALVSVHAGVVAVSHCTAARVHGLPVPRACEHDDLHVMAAGVGRVRRPGVVGHRGLASREVVTIAGVAVTSLGDTWLDLAPFVSLDDLVVLGDAVARRLGDVGPLLRRLDCRVPGVTRAREALTWVRSGSASPMETRARVLFVRGGLPEPSLNAPIRDHDGGWLATGDLVWEDEQVVGEYQGADHFGDYRRGDDDIQRRRLVEGAGWTYVDFTKDDYFRRPRRVALLRRLASELDVDLPAERVDEVARQQGLPGLPLRRCGG